jgi:hypothetical protein
MYDLQRQIDHLARAAEPAEADTVLTRVEALLNKAEGGLGVLLADSNKAALLPAVATSRPAASDAR